MRADRNERHRRSELQREEHVEVFETDLAVVVNIQVDDEAFNHEIGVLVALHDFVFAEESENLGETRLHR